LRVKKKLGNKEKVERGGILKKADGWGSNEVPLLAV